MSQLFRTRARIWIKNHEFKSNFHRFWKPWTKINHWRNLMMIWISLSRLSLKRLPLTFFRTRFSKNLNRRRLKTGQLHLTSRWFYPTSSCPPKNRSPCCPFLSMIVNFYPTLLYYLPSSEIPKTLTIRTTMILKTTKMTFLSTSSRWITRASKLPKASPATTTIQCPKTKHWILSPCQWQNSS